MQTEELVQLAVAALSSLQTSLLFKVAQRCLPRVHRDVDAPTASAVPSVWPTARHVRFSAHGGSTVASSTGGKMQVNDVEEHRYGRKRAGL